MMVIRTHRSAYKLSPLELQQMIQQAPAALVDNLIVMTKKTTKKRVLRMSRMGGRLASACVVTFRWIGRKEQLPGHYHMAMDFLGTPATSTPSERVNSMAGREFTTARQSLSTDIFIKTMCLRSWMKAGIIKVPVDRQKALMSLTRLLAAAAAATIDDVVSTIEMDQEECWVEEEVLDDSALDMLNNQFDHLTAEEPEA